MHVKQKRPLANERPMLLDYWVGGKYTGRWTPALVQCAHRTPKWKPGVNPMCGCRCPCPCVCMLCYVTICYVMPLEHVCVQCRLVVMHFNVRFCLRLWVSYCTRCLTVCLRGCLSVCLLASLSGCCVLVCLIACLYVCLPVCLFVCLLARSLACLCVCLFVC